MKIVEILSAWKGMLAGRLPSLSIEVTRECPLRCPGCYAYDEAHLGGGVTLRELRDFKGEALVKGVLEVVDRVRPMHLSIVGGDPLVRYREMEQLIPQLLERGIYTQVVTSAFRDIPQAWIGLPRLSVVVSIDGLQPEHDARRAPATYDRILKSIAGHQIVIHSTVTGQMMRSPGHLDQFLAFWNPREEVRKVWFSLFTPQVGDDMPEILTPEERSRAVDEFLVLREKYPKLDMGPRTIQEFRTPPQSPADCVFSQTTHTISADLRTKVTPCQFGGNPDCGQCGCIASAGLASIGRYKVFGLVRADSIMKASIRIGQMLNPEPEPEPEPAPLRVLQ